MFLFNDVWIIAQTLALFCKAHKNKLSYNQQNNNRSSIYDSHLPSYRSHHSLSSGAPAASHATRDLLSTRGCVVVTIAAVITAVGLSRSSSMMMVVHVSGRFSPSPLFID